MLADGQQAWGRDEVHTNQVFFCHNIIITDQGLRL